MKQIIIASAFLLSLSGRVSTSSESAKACGLEESVVEMEDGDSKLVITVQPNVDNEVAFRATLTNPSKEKGTKEEFRAKITDNGKPLPTELFIFTAINGEESPETSWKKKGSSCSLKGETIQLIWRNKASSIVTF